MTFNDYFHSDSKCLVYLITCRTCKLQYTDQTCHTFRQRWNNYKCCTRKADKGEECKQKYLHVHFSLYDYHGFLNDGQVTLIDKTLALDPTKRDSILAWEPLKHTTHMVWIRKRNFSGCYYVGVLHGFVCFFGGISVYVKCTNACN